MEEERVMEIADDEEAWVLGEEEGWERMVEVPLELREEGSGPQLLGGGEGEEGGKFVVSVMGVVRKGKKYLGRRLYVQHGGFREGVWWYGEGGEMLPVLEYDGRRGVRVGVVGCGMEEVWRMGMSVEREVWRGEREDEDCLERWREGVGLLYLGCEMEGVVRVTVRVMYGGSSDYVRFYVLGRGVECF
jgi:hypothetical protein